MIDRTQIALATVLVLIIILLVTGVNYTFFPAKEPVHHNPVILSLPTSPPGAPDNNRSNNQPIPLLDIRLSQNPESTESFKFNITQGQTIQINVTLSSLSNSTELIVPLYLSVGSFENQPSVKMIACPPLPYPTLPWSSYEETPNASKPFNANYSSNPLILLPNGNQTSILTITAFEDAQVGKYSIIVEMGNWEQTGLGGVTFFLEILPRQN